MSHFIVHLLLLSLISSVLAMGSVAQEQPAWQAWESKQFEKAKQTGALVLLHVKAQWCAACAKMEANGLSDPRVVELLRQRYLAVRADFDQETELMRRYAIHGVPAVLIFDSAGQELIRRSGYLEPDWLYWLLLAVADDPRPEAHQ
ncbi:MAG: DUF255 domain-containing protein [Thioploca sp.]|nr:DUF255 domain-containing protein [Thioploca sp.]